MTTHETPIELIEQAQPRALVAPTPTDLLAMAVQRGTDIAQLERLMALQERWEANEARREFVAAMAAFKAEPMTIFKRKKVGFMGKDGFVGYSHAELSDITDVVGPMMAKHGLTTRWEIRQEGGRILVTCVVTHRRGHSESVTMDAPPDDSGKKNSIQQIASATTYLQRYTLLAVTGMSTKGMDNDGRDADDQPANPEVAKLTEDGEAAAMNGMKALTAWWAKLDRKQQSLMNKPFAAMRKAAAAADAGVNHGQ